MLEEGALNLRRARRGSSLTSRNRLGLIFALVAVGPACNTPQRELPPEPPPPAQPKRPAGVAACQSGATAECAAACRAGDAGSCDRALILLRRADGANGVAHAVRLFQDACEGGTARACFEFGRAHQSGWGGLAPNEATGASWFRKSCERADVGGCAAWGQALVTGQGVAADPEAARPILQHACESGEPLACFHFARAVLDGRLGTDTLPAEEQNLPSTDTEELGTRAGEALPWFRKAERHNRRLCAADEPERCSNLALMYRQGWGVEQDDALAVHWYTEGCQGGDPVGCMEAVALQQAGRGPAITREAAHAGLKRACTLGSQEACQELSENGVP